ncbi:M14 family metallopeptidase [Chitinimonas sp.]|uniref:M14 family metallopeptidase n=1 Tax=Chitinimonas sp. TaxID=1934313 RepID=UPI0035B2BFF0
MHIQRHPLISPSLGTQRELLSFHYGPRGRGEKVYLQASLHADELPGMLVLHYLKQRLAQAEQAGLLRGEVVVVPVANPIGLSQNLLQLQLGRFEMSCGENFNRRYPEFAEWLGDQLEGRLGNDGETNKRIIRSAMQAALAAQRPLTELGSLRQLLTGLALDADVVLDLHCDFEAVMHVYCETPCLDQAEPLYRLLGAEAVLYAKGSGGASFDEALSGVWWQLAERFAGRFPIPQACFSATVELRGQADVDGAQAQHDAGQLFAYLQARGVVQGDMPALPPARCTPTPLAGSETLRAPHAGVMVFRHQPGDWIEAGQTVLEVIDPLSDTVSAVKASVSGRLYARENRRYALQGMDLCRIAGAVAFRTGYLLSA